MKIKIDDRLIDRFFLRETTPRENEVLSGWIQSDPAHREAFDRAYDLFVLSQVLLGGRTASEVRKKNPSKRWRTPLWAALGAVGIAAALAVGIFYGRNHYSKPLLDVIEGAALVSETQPGLRSTVFLSDGTRVDLNSGSRISYPAIFYDGERRVQLQGEALFDVAKDPEHPFIVETFSYDVKVLGTRFDVVADEEQGEFSVALLEGSVQLLDKHERVAARLEPDQMARLQDGHLVLSRTENPEAYLWTDGIVSMTGVSFDEAMKILERAYGVHIVNRRTSAPEIRYAYLKFRISDGIEHALRILRRRCDFTYTFDETDGIYYID